MQSEILIGWIYLVKCEVINFEGKLVQMGNMNGVLYKTKERKLVS